MSERDYNRQVERRQRISNPKIPIAKRLYSIPEAAVYLGRTVWGIREMVWGGKITCIKVGRRVLIDIRDMDKWIEHNKMTFSY